MLQPSKENGEDTHFRLSFGIMLCDDQCDKGKLIGVIVVFPIDAMHIRFDK